MAMRLLARNKFARPLLRREKAVRRHLEHMRQREKLVVRNAATTGTNVWTSVKQPPTPINRGGELNLTASGARAG